MESDVNRKPYHRPYLGFAIAVCVTLASLYLVVTELI